MKSSNLKAQENKHISLTNSKYINQNKYPKSKIKSNTRYISNINNKGNNNHLLYKSENKSGYNQLIFPSFSPNNDLLLIKNAQQKNSYQNYKINQQKNGVNIPLKNSLNWNNIGYKEVKFKNNFENKTSGLNNNNDLLKSYNELNNYGTNANNLGFHNTYNINSNTNNKNKTITKSNTNINNKKNNILLNNNYQNKIITNKNNVNNNNNNLYSKKIFSNNILDNGKGILVNSYSVSPNNNYNYISKFNEPYNINKSTELNPIFNSTNKKYQKQAIRNNRINENNSLYDYYKNLIKIQNARNGVQSRIVKNRINDEDNIKNIRKIQAVWKGVYVRELMSYYWSFNKFQNNIEKILDNHYKMNFFNNLKKFNKNKEEQKENGINIATEINSNKRQNELINEYNNILKKFNDYKNDNEKKKNYEFIIDKNDNFDIINYENKYKNKNNNNDDTIKLRSVNKNNKNLIISYDDYLKHFNNNLKIINNEEINLDKIKKKYVYDIGNNNYFTLKTEIIPKQKVEEKKVESNREFKDNEIKKENFFDILKIKKIKNFDNNNIYIENNTCFDIFSEKKSKDEHINELNENNQNNEDNKINNTHFEEFDNYYDLKNEKIKKNQEINIFNNDRFVIIQTKSEENKEKENKNQLLLPSNANDLFYKGTQKEKIDKNTETMNLSNLIEPNKNTELIYYGIIKEEIQDITKVDESIETMNLINLIKPNKNCELKYEGKIKEEIVKIDETTETMNIINLIKPNKNSELKYEGIIKENNIINNINNRLDYNSINEIDKGEALEINPFEIKRTKSNIIITYENDIEVLINKNDAFKAKAKQKMIKIILPIRLKSILVKSIRKKIFFKLIKQAHKICFFIHINKILFNYDKKMKKEGIKKLKENSNNVKLKIIIEKEIAKYEMRKIMNKYVDNKLNKGLIELANMIINNK